MLESFSLPPICGEGGDPGLDPGELGGVSQYGPSALSCFQTNQKPISMTLMTIISCMRELLARRRNEANNADELILIGGPAGSIC